MPWKVCIKVRAAVTDENQNLQRPKRKTITPIEVRSTNWGKLQSVNSYWKKLTSLAYRGHVHIYCRYALCCKNLVKLQWQSVNGLCHLSLLSGLKHCLSAPTTGFIPVYCQTPSSSLTDWQVSNIRVARFLLWCVNQDEQFFQWHKEADWSIHAFRTFERW